MPQTVVEKIAQAHLAAGPSRPLRTGDFVSIRPFHVLTHDNTSAVMSKFKAIGATTIHDPKQLVFALDHDVQNHDEANQRKYCSIESFAATHGVDFYPAGAGIGHQIMIERGYVTPGSFVVASDSHSNMYGALGAVGTPIVRTDAAAVWATGEFWWQIPRTIQVVLEGNLPEGVSGKDVIITLCGLYNHDEALNAALEFSGPGVASLSMDARFSIANMSTEWGPIVCWFPVDGVTIRYLENAHRKLQEQGVERFTEEDIERWRKAPPQPDPDAVYSARITLDLSQVTPHVSGPDTVQTMHSIAEIEKQKIADSEGLPSLLRQLAPGGPRSCRVGTVRKQSRFGREVLYRSGQRVGAERGGAPWRLASLAGRGRHPAAAELRPVHRVGNGTSGKRRGWHFGHESQLQGPHGIARRAVLSRQSRSGGGIRTRRLHPRARGASQIASRSVGTRN